MQMRNQLHEDQTFEFSRKDVHGRTDLGKRLDSLPFGNQNVGTLSTASVISSCGLLGDASSLNPSIDCGSHTVKGLVTGI